MKLNRSCTFRNQLIAGQPLSLVPVRFSNYGLLCCASVELSRSERPDQLASLGKFGPRPGRQRQLYGPKAGSVCWGALV